MHSVFNFRFEVHALYSKHYTQAVVFCFPWHVRFGGKFIFLVLLHPNSLKPFKHSAYADCIQKLSSLMNSLKNMFLTVCYHGFSTRYLMALKRACLWINFNHFVSHQGSLNGYKKTKLSFRQNTRAQVNNAVGCRKGLYVTVRIQGMKWMYMYIQTALTQSQAF